MNPLNSLPGGGSELINLRELINLTRREPLAHPVLTRPAALCRIEQKERRNLGPMLDVPAWYMTSM